MSVIKICENWEAIKKAIDAFLPLEPHYSSRFPVTTHGIGNERLGWYYKLGAMKVRQALVDEICKEHQILLAEHKLVSGHQFHRGEPRVFRYWLQKSRFGEKYVTRRNGGGAKGISSDKPEAVAYAQGRYEKSVSAIHEALVNGGVDAGKKIKRGLMANGDFIA